MDQQIVQETLGLINALLKHELSERRIPGMAVAIIYDDKIVWVKGYGYADKEKKNNVTGETIFRIGSLTKLFTAIMLMQLYERGKLCLDDPIEKYTPEFKIKSDYNGSRPITFRQVASHMAGLPREAPLNYWQTLEFPNIKEILHSLGKSHLIFPPMTKFKYSNLGYAILGYALQIVSGDSYERYVQENILKPLGMKNSRFHVTSIEKSSIATGYLYSSANDLEIAPQIDFRGLSPAGQLYSSIEDISKLISLQFLALPENERQIIDNTSIREMHSPIHMFPNWQGGVSIGWLLGRLRNHTLIGHSGGLPGYCSDILVIPDLRVGIAIFANVDTEIWKVSQLCMELLVLIHLRITNAEIKTPRTNNISESLKKYEGSYKNPLLGEKVVNLSNGNLSIYDPENPQSQITLVPQKGSQFIVKGGFVDGELALFDLDQNGKAKSVRLGSYLYQRTSY